MSGAPLPAAAGEDLALDVVRFRCGTWSLAIEARHVRGASSAPAASAAVAIEALLGWPPAPAGPRHCLSVRPPQAGTARAVAVDGPVELLPLAAAHIHALPPLLAARCQLRGLRALAWTGPLNQPPLLLLDAAALLAHAPALPPTAPAGAAAPGISAH